VLYHKGNYAEAQNFFKRAIITNPNCDPSVRLVSNTYLSTSNLLLYQQSCIFIQKAFGCCFFKLEQFERATLAASDVIAKDVSRRFVEISLFNFA
jgi:hypothetical protein